jgi:hypothetical protein
VAHEEGNLNDLRAILGNDIAINASRERKLPYRTAPSLPGSPGVTTRWRKAKKPLAVSNLSWRDHPRTGFSSWSRTQQNTPRPAAGSTLNLTTANPPARRCTTPAFRATRPSKLATLSSTVTHPNTRSHRMPRRRSDHSANRSEDFCASIARADFCASAETSTGLWKGIYR